MKNALLAAGLAVSCPFAAVRADVIITEFMADNKTTLADENGSHPDWIELFNTGAAVVNLENWALTDDAAVPTKWKFPAVTLASGAHLVVFASNDDKAVPGEPLHTNFKLDAGSGEYLALVRPDGTKSSEFAPAYPPQYADVSFGLAAESQSTTVVAPNAPATWLVPANDALGTAWTAWDFADGAWTAGSVGIGFDTGGTDSGDSYAESVLANAPAGYWRLGETSGTTAANAGSLGAAADGALLNNPVTGVAGPRPAAYPGFEGSNAGMRFNGSSTKVDVPFNTALNTASFTVECWARVTGGSSYRAAVTSRDDGPQRGFIFYCTPSNVWEFWTGTGSSWNSINGGAVTTNQWYHLVGTYDSATQTKRFYVNGVLKGTNTSAVSLNTARPLRIGAGSTEGTGQYFFTGDIDEVAVFGRALSEAEITARWTVATLGGSSSGQHYTGLIQTDVAAAAHTVNPSLYVRIPFTVTDPSSVAKVTLLAKYDDGFQAWLNGVPVAASNAPLAIAWNSAATERQPTSDALAYESFDLSGHLDALRPGANVLAVQALNLAADNPDLLFVPQLTLQTRAQYAPPPAGYFAHATPGEQNDATAPDLGPILTGFGRTPATPPTVNDDIAVTCRVLATQAPVSTVTLNWRVMFGAVQQTPMLDDGLSGDGAAGDGVFGAIIPKASYSQGNMVRWFITATDTAARTSRWPLFTEPTNSPEYEGTMVADTRFTTQLPVWYWFAQNPSAGSTRAGTRGAVFFNGELYDNIFIRQRGGATSSNSRKFDFNSGRHAFISEKVGRVEEANLNGSGQDPTLIRPSLAFQTFELADHDSITAFPVMMRVNGGADTAGGNGGIAYYVEQPDERWLDRIGLDRDGALYKFDQRSDLNPAYTDTTNGVEKKTRLTEDRSDLQAVVTALAAATPAATRQTFMFDNFDLPNMANYLACRAIFNDFDDVRKNWYFYRDTERKKEWHLLPWDKDGAWGIQGDAGSWWPHPLFGDQAHLKSNANQWSRLWDGLFNNARTRAMYLRRLRTLMDEQLGTAPGALEARVAAWWAPIAPHKAGVNTNGITNWLPTRRTQLFTTYSAPNSVIGTDEIPPAQAADVALSFGGIDFNPASGNQDEEFVEIVNANDTAVDISRWVVDGGIRHTFKGGTVIPANESLILANKSPAFRARTVSPKGGENRLVVGNFDGSLSARGENFTLSDPTGRLVATGTFAPAPTPAQQWLRVTEIMFDPPAGGSFAAGEYEFIELMNAGTAPLDLTGAFFDEGIDFAFATTTVVPAGGRIVLVKNPAAFAERHGAGVTPAGTYTGSLDNSGERLRVIDGVGEEVLDFRYEATWFPLAAGGGSSLVLVDPAGDWTTWPVHESWRTSSAAGGSPGAADPLPAAAAPVGVSGGTVQFTGQPGRTYRIQLSDDLAAWTDAGFVDAGPDGTFGWTDADPPADRRYYRAVSH